MTARDPSKMALQIAGLRANETYLPEDERVFEDPYAEYFFPMDIRQMFQDPVLVKAERAKYEAIMPGVNGAIVARIRYIDECLADAIRNGLQQVVIVGAGFDTRAYRIPGVREQVKVFEVDHPMTQDIKMRTIREIFGDLPDHVAFVPIVFGQDRMDKQLTAHAYDAGLKTLFIIEGLLMYIPAAAVEALLAFIRNASGPGSGFVADFFDRSVVDGTSTLPEARALKRFVEQEGAALQFGLDGDGVQAYLKARGFSRVETINATDLKAKFFPAAGPDRRVSPMFNFVTATV